MVCLMTSCTLYLDADGDPGWCPPFGKSQLRWYVLAGVALAPESDLKARLEVERILSKYIPDSVRRSWPHRYYEICYHDIQRGKNVYSHLDHPQRKAMSDEIFGLILGLKPVLFATAVDKVNLKQRYGSNAHSPRSYALRATIHRYSMYLNKNSLIGTVLFDQEEYRKDKELQAMVHEFRRTGVILRGMHYQPRYEDRLERVLNTITFAPSETSPGLQLADVCSRSTWAHFERGKSNRFNQISSLWNRSNSRRYEPSVVPHET